MAINPRQIYNILIFRNDRFGEFLLNIPAFRALKEHFPAATLTVVISPYLKELIPYIPFVDSSIEWTPNKHNLREKLKFAKYLRGKDIDMAVMLNPGRDFNIIALLAGINIRVGYNRKWAFLLTHKLKDEKHLGKKHEVEYNLELVDLVGAKTEDKRPFLNISDSLAGETLKRFGLSGSDNLIALHPWASDPLKLWPQERFRDLAKGLSGLKGLKLIVVGGKEEMEKAKSFFNGINNSIMNLVGRTTLVELAAILKKCKLLVSADSGPMHMASCVGTPVIALFRSDLPGKTSKRWGPCGENHIIIEKNNLNEITVDEVVKNVKEKLKL